MPMKKLQRSQTELRRRRFVLKVKPVKLEVGHGEAQNYGTKIVVETRLRYIQNKSSFLLISPKKEVRRVSSQKVIGEYGGGDLEWDQNEEGLEHLCSFSAGDQLDCWVSFSVLQKLERKNQKSEKWQVMETVEMKVVEFGKKRETRMPMKLLNAAGATFKATLTVVTSSDEPGELEFRGGRGYSPIKPGFLKWMKNRLMLTTNQTKRKPTQGDDGVEKMDSGVGCSNESTGLILQRTMSESDTTASQETQSPERGLVGKVSFWKRSRSWLAGGKGKVEPLIKKMVARDVVEVDQLAENVAWEAKNIVSRDGEAELKCSVSFASFDQCGEKVAGEAACSAIATVIAHWLCSHKGLTPTKSELDQLMVEGAAELEKLCSNEAYLSRYPDRHFDIETVVEAGIRPLVIKQENSLVGFFYPEKFKFLDGHVSVDGIWKHIESKPGVYIVSWNDHFFVLKVDVDAYYLIDSLGKRLYDRCNQAFILKFDESSVMQEKVKKPDQKNTDGVAATKSKEVAPIGISCRAETKAETDAEASSAEPAAEKLIDEKEKIICRGRECCKEFIKTFLAAIPVKQLEIKQQTGEEVSSEDHRRLQIEFHYTTLSEL